MAISTVVQTLLLFLSTFPVQVDANLSKLPLVINTWPFTNATEKAWKVLQTGGKQGGTGRILDAVVAGCGECQTQQCDGTVGYGGSPDEIGETTLDAMLMNGDTFEVGSVGDLRRVKDAIGVARAVMDYTDHTLIVGESATAFAVEMGFKQESLSTNQSIQIWRDWKANNCQPNYRKNVDPDPRSSCGPYRPKGKELKGKRLRSSVTASPDNHDTIGMVVVDESSRVAAGTSTNGMDHKVPGRVGDSPVMGAGSYAWSKVGGAAATGDGDIMMRFLPSFQAVNLLTQGRNVTQAAREAIAPIAKFYPDYVGALIVTDALGNFDAACHNLPGGFHYSVANPSTNGKAHVFVAKCT